jgi:hypothetical protein
MSTTGARQRNSVDAEDDVLVLVGGLSLEEVVMVHYELLEEEEPLLLVIRAMFALWAQLVEDSMSEVPQRVSMASLEVLQRGTEKSFLFLAS